MQCLSPCLVHYSEFQHWVDIKAVQDWDLCGCKEDAEAVTVLFSQPLRKTLYGWYPAVLMHQVLHWPLTQISFSCLTSIRVACCTSSIVYIHTELEGPLSLLLHYLFTFYNTYNPTEHCETWHKLVKAIDTFQPSCQDNTSIRGQTYAQWQNANTCGQQFSCCGLW